MQNYFGAFCLVIIIQSSVIAFVSGGVFLPLTEKENKKHVYEINHDEALKDVEEQAEITFLDNNHIDRDILRSKREFDFVIEGESDGDDHEISAEAIGNLFRSEDGKTKIEASAGYTHRFGSAEDGSYKLSLKVTFI